MPAWRFRSLMLLTRIFTRLLCVDPSKIITTLSCLLLFAMFVLILLVSVLTISTSHCRTQINSNATAENDVVTTTYKYPTAVWRAESYNRKEEESSTTPKLYLFKPSPFLKPPFIDRDFGVSIARIEDEDVNVTGKRRGKIKYKHTVRKEQVVKANRNDTVLSENIATSVDKFLEQSLKKYLFSSHFKDIIGDITVEEFAEVLHNITASKENKKPSVSLFEENKEHYVRFRDESLNPKRKSENTTPVSIPSRQLKRRLEANTETTPIPFLSSTVVIAFAENRIDNDTSENSTTLQFDNLSSSTTTSKTESTTKFFTAESPTPYTAASSLIPSKKPSRGRKKFRHTTTNSPELKLSVAESAYYTVKPYVEQELSIEKESAAGSIPGEPGIDYPIYSFPPFTGFKCPTFKAAAPKILADRSTRCQVFYVCTGDGPAAPTLCPNGTMFNEQVLVCDWWYNVDC